MSLEGLNNAHTIRLPQPHASQHPRGGLISEYWTIFSFPNLNSEFRSQTNESSDQIILPTRWRDLGRQRPVQTQPAKREHLQSCFAGHHPCLLQPHHPVPLPRPSPTPTSVPPSSPTSQAITHAYFSPTSPVQSHSPAHHPRLLQPLLSVPLPSPSPTPTSVPPSSPTSQAITPAYFSPTSPVPQAPLHLLTGEPTHPRTHTHPCILGFTKLDTAYLPTGNRVPEGQVGEKT